jgi:hypothetical protein
MQQVHCDCQEDQAVDDQDPKPPPEEQSAGAVPEGIGELPKASISDGRIPPELREWVLAQLGPFDESIYENLDEEDMLELHEFLDLEELEREAAREQAYRAR